MRNPLRRESKEFPPLMVDEVCACVKEMIEAGTICSSQSPWCNAVVLVYKKDGGLHFCIYFCKLNARTKKDSYPLPWIQEAIASLVGAGYFSCLELKLDFWQITMDEALNQYTTLTLGNLGFLSANVCHLGCTMPLPLFKRLMQNCLKELSLIYCLIYLDNVIVFSKIEEEHLKYLCVVFIHFQEDNLRLEPTKCKFLWDEINYLVHHVSKEGMWPSKKNLKAAAEFPPSHTYTEIRAFLGLVGHYRWFIKGVAHIAQPLHEHLSGEGAHKKKQASDAHGRGQGCLWDS